MTTPRHGEPPIDQPYPAAPLGAAFRRFWKKGFTFTGRASRSEYWKAYLVTVGLFAVLYLLAVFVMAAAAASYSQGTIVFGQLLVAIAVLYGLATLIPSLAAVVRRLHDTNQSGAMYFVSLIPFVGGIILLVMLAQESNPQGARFDVTPSPAGVPPVPPPPPPGAALPPVPAPQLVAASVPPPPAPAALFASTPPPPLPPVPAPVSASAGSAAPPLPPVPASASASAAPAVPPPPVPAAAQTAPPVPPPPVPMPASWLPVPAPAVPAAPAAATVPLPEPEPDLDETRITTPPAGGWVVELPGGRRLPVGGAVFFGRSPVAEPATPNAVLVPIDDPLKSMSKTHARVDVEAGLLTVTDLHSTNGTSVRDASGSLVMLTPGSPHAIDTATEISFGDYAVALRRG